jgi:hypothetical protein
MHAAQPQRPSPTSAAPLTGGALLSHLRAERAEFTVLRRHPQPQGADLTPHQRAQAADPTLYALCALDPRLGRAQRARALFVLLTASRKGYDPAQRALLDRVTRWLLVSLPADKALEAMIATCKARANHKHTRRAMLRYVLNHPALPSMVAARRPTLVQIIEHALGRDTARGCVNALQPDAPNHRSALLRWADDPARAASALLTLYKRAPSTPCAATNAAALTDTPDTADTPDALDYTQTHLPFSPSDITPSSPKTVTATNRGAISAHLVNLYRGGPCLDLEAAAALALDTLALNAPRFHGRVAVVFDASASTASYGDRAFCCLSQSAALHMLMARCCPDLHTLHVSGDPSTSTLSPNSPLSTLSVPTPCGSTDLAAAVLDTLALSPDLIAVITDGYENHLGGDLAAVLDALPAAGIHTPIILCHSLFTHKDDLSLRKPTSGWPELTFWHQDDLNPLLTSLFSLAQGTQGTTFLKKNGMDTLAQREVDSPPWLTL